MNIGSGYVFSPGETIQQMLEDRGLVEQDFIEQMPYEDGLVRDLLNDEVDITEPIAESLSEVLGKSPSFWLERSEQFGRGFY